MDHEQHDFLSVYPQSFEDHAANYGQAYDDNPIGNSFDASYIKIFTDTKKSNEQDYDLDLKLQEKQDTRTNSLNNCNSLNSSKSSNNTNSFYNFSQGNEEGTNGKNVIKTIFLFKKKRKRAKPTKKEKVDRNPRHDEIFKAIKSTSFTELVRNKIYFIERNKKKKNITNNFTLIKTIFKEFRKLFIVDVKKENNINKLDLSFKDIMINCFSKEHKGLLNYANFDQIFSEESRGILNKTYFEIVKEFKDNRSLISDYLNNLRIDDKNKKYVNDFKKLFIIILNNLRLYLSLKKIDFDFYDHSENCEN